MIDAAPDLAALCGLRSAARWQRCAANPLASAHTPSVDGRTDWTMADPSILYDATAGVWKAWWSTLVTSDCHDILTGDREIHLRYAESRDGVSWQIQPEPVLRSHRTPGDWDYSTVETPTVIVVPGAPADRRYAVLYAGADDDVRVLGQSAWQIGLAFSADGRAFTRVPAAESPYGVDGLVLRAPALFSDRPAVVDGITADPELIVRDGVFHLYASSVGVDAGGAYVDGTYGISHATSPDLIHWTPVTPNPISTLIGGGQASVIEDGAGLVMWFGQDSDADTASIPSDVFETLGFWKATSTDGIAWTRAGAARDFTWLASDPAEDLGLINGADVARGPDGELRLYYAGWGTAVQPPGSCVYTKTGIVEGTFNLLLAVTP